MEFKPGDVVAIGVDSPTNLGPCFDWHYFGTIRRGYVLEVANGFIKLQGMQGYSDGWISEECAIRNKIKPIQRRLIRTERRTTKRWIFFGKKITKDVEVKYWEFIK